MKEQIQYIGEHLLPGQIGYFLVLFAFVASCLSAVSYFFATQRRTLPEANSWKNMGRTAFVVHGISVFIVIGLIFFMMINQYYEYQYVQAHVNEDLPMRFIFSAFWEGQEGSFLLWMFWHVVLGFVMMKTAKSWESPIMAIFALVQLMTLTMILGVHFNIGETAYKIGNNPFLLLRDTMDIPIFSSADYVSLIKGKGMNPLLQNYWMTIHPPTLFLGFASTLVPFAYAMAGLWTGRHKEWLQAVMPWALFSAAILGLGILMGGAWAYEALSFGGYWAWDPVENASLVPWIILIAGVHTNLIANATGHSIKSTYIFYLLCFIFIIYSTLLTRSGILGDTSVHAFTEMGLELLLEIFILIIIFISLFAFIKAYKNIPNIEKEEATSSREFWMFIGAMVLLFSAVLITFTTSIPLYKKVAAVFGLQLNITSPLDPIEHYNKYQLWIGVFVGLLSGVAQYLRFKAFNWEKQKIKFYKRMGIAMFIAALFSFLFSLWININTYQYGLLLFAAIFGIVSNIDYLINFLKFNLKLGASVIAHVGFGIMVLGILASGLNKRYISSNPMVQRNFIPEDMLLKNVMLIKGMPMLMNGFEVTYLEDTLVGHIRSFEVDFKKKGNQGETLEQFQVFPNIQYTTDFSNMAAPNPSTKRYLHKDIFTHIANIPAAEVSAEARQAKEDSLNYQNYASLLNQAFYIEDSIRNVQYEAMIKSINRKPTHSDYEAEEKDIALGVHLVIKDLKNGDSFDANPMLALRGNLIYHFPFQINELSLKIKLKENLLDQIFTPEDQISYTEFLLKKNEFINFGGHQVKFMDFERKVDHPQYEADENDIAVSALLKIGKIPDGSAADSKIYTAKPVFIIRGNQAFNLKAVVEELGLHFRFVNIDATNGSIRLLVAEIKNSNPTVPLEIATNSFRTDYIILEAIEFPGINLFWMGTLMMFFGLSLGMWQRWRR